VSAPLSPFYEIYSSETPYFRLYNYCAIITKFL